MHLLRVDGATNELSRCAEIDAQQVTSRQGHAPRGISKGRRRRESAQANELALDADPLRPSCPPAESVALSPKLFRAAAGDRRESDDRLWASSGVGWRLFTSFHLQMHLPSVRDVAVP